MGTCRRMRACADEFLAMVTEGYQLSFGVTQRHKVSGNKWMFHNCVSYKLHTVVEGQCWDSQKILDKKL